jgi:hypothetical protein
LRRYVDLTYDNNGARFGSGNRLAGLVEDKESMRQAMEWAGTRARRIERLGFVRREMHFAAEGLSGSKNERRHYDSGTVGTSRQVHAGFLQKRSTGRDITDVSESAASNLERPAPLY